MKGLFNKAQKEGLARVFDSLAVAATLAIAVKAHSTADFTATVIGEILMLIYGLLSSLAFALELRKDMS